MRAGGSLFSIHYHCTYKSTSSVDDPCRSNGEIMNSFQTSCGILIHYNEQNLEIIESMRAGNGKQIIILEWP